MPIVALKDSPSPDRSIAIDGKKFLWDGNLFHTPEEASSQAEAYLHDNFEVQLVEQGEKHLVYTRRALKEVVVTAP